MVGEWIPVFRAGSHTDSAGVTREWTEADLDAIAKKYEPAQHEAPVVVGHPKDNAPAYGWVEKLKREGEVLYAQFKDLVPEFVGWVKQGLYKKRSISLYPDMSLRHVGYLGAVPPAVQGLPDHVFAGVSAVTIEVDKGGAGIAEGIFRRLRAYFEDREGEKREHSENSEGGRQMVDDLVEMAKRIKELEWALAESEKQAAGDRNRADEYFLENQRLREALLEMVDVRDKKESDQLTVRLMNEGRLTPAQRAIVVDLMGVLSGSEKHEFAESDVTGEVKTVKALPRAKFVEFLNSLPVQVHYGEHATTHTANAFDIRGRRAELVSQYREQNKGVSYKEAVIAVLGAHPELREG